jgi:dienelactone hydrolase
MKRSAVALILSLPLAFPAYAQLARIEIHPVESLTLTDQQTLTGDKNGKRVVIAGELRLPTLGRNRLPAVILVHGSGGVSGYVDDWSHPLNAMGVATFILDSFTGRGISRVDEDQDQLPRLAQTLDLFRALEVLAKHPRIDPQRIAVMGFSRGGGATLAASLKRVHRLHAAAGGPEIAAYIALYASCNTAYVDAMDVVDKPMRLFHGAADDWNPAETCRAYADRLRSAGRDVAFTQYAGAHHVFDWARLKKPLKLANVQSARACRLQEGADGRIVNAVTGAPFTWAGDPCVERGATVAYDAEAHSQALEDVTKFIRAALGVR